MAETAFAQGEPIWDEFDAEYDTADYHSDWSYYSDGGFFSDEEHTGQEDMKKKSTAGQEVPGGVAGARGAREDVSGGIGEKTTAAKVAGRPARKRRRLMVVDESEKVAFESAPTSGKVTSTVIVPPATTPTKKKPTELGDNINEVDKKIDLDKDSAKTSLGAGVSAIRASVKRKPLTDEVPVSP